MAQLRWWNLWHIQNTTKQISSIRGEDFSLMLLLWMKQAQCMAQLRWWNLWQTQTSSNRFLCVRGQDFSSCCYSEWNRPSAWHSQGDETCDTLKTPPNRSAVSGVDFSLMLLLWMKQAQCMAQLRWWNLWQSHSKYHQTGQQRQRRRFQYHVATLNETGPVHGTLSR